MEKIPQPSTRGLVVVILVGVLVLHAALLTALVFRDTGQPPAAPPPAVLEHGAPPAAPPPAMAAPGEPRRPASEPLRVSPTGPVGKALGQ